MNSNTRYIFELSTGYSACDIHTKKDEPHHNGDVILNPHSNSYVWDLSFNKTGKYSVSIYVKWLPNQTKIGRGDLMGEVKYHLAGINSVEIHNRQKYNKVSENDVICIDNIYAYDCATSIMIRSRSGNMRIGALVIEYLGDETFSKGKSRGYSSFRKQIRGDEIITDITEPENEPISYVEIAEVSHKAGTASVTDFLGIHSTLTAMYREFSIVKYVPYTDFTISFNGGEFGIEFQNMRKGKESYINFSINNHNGFKAKVVAHNKKSIVFDKANTATISFQHDLKLKTNYKVFMKLETGFHFGVEATYYHAFFSEKKAKKWYYLGTIGRFGHHSMGRSGGFVENDEANGHLKTRIFKYGAGWFYDEEGNASPVERMNCHTNEAESAKILFDPRNFMAEIHLGGGTYTTTPLPHLSKSRIKEKEPNVPYGYEPEKHAKKK